VLALTLILGIQNGFREAFIRQILETTGHVTLSLQGRVIRGYEERLESIRREVPGVIGAAPAVLGQGILEVESSFMGVNIKGFDPAQEGQVTRLVDFIQEGGARDFAGANEVLLGKRLAEDLRLQVGDPVKLVLPGGALYNMWVRGIVASGVQVIDRQTVFTSLRFARKAFGYQDGVSHLFVACKNPEQADLVARQVSEVTGLDGESWKQQHLTLLKAMDLERRAMFVIIALTLMVAGFGVSNVLTLMVYDKYQDVGILRSIGASRGTILWMFMLQGLLIGVGGTLLGIFLSIGAGELLQFFPIQLPGEIYYADTVPVQFRFNECFAIACFSLLVSLLAGLPSTLRALRVDPVEVIHGA
jgi:ABC-type lipoprotein release transport system permease subunit